MNNDEQRAYWSGEVGTRWATLGSVIDTSFAPVTEAIVAEADLTGTQAVLDVGCGGGALTRALAARARQVTGVDVSAPMLATARAAAVPNTRFLEADAQIHASWQDRFDRIVSRFGVMFFADTVAAFANLHRAAAPDGRLIVAAWGPAEANPWFTVPRAAAVARLGPVQDDPDAPGPFRFRDAGRVVDWLSRAGWRDAAATPLDLSLTPPGSPAEVAAFSTRIGGASRVLSAHGADEATRSAVARDLEPAFAAMTGMGGTRVPARINLFTARA